VKASASVEVHPRGRLLGNVETPSLQVEKGAVLEGDVRMASGPRPAPAPTPDVGPAR
jgi:cytoskeletal protein CcmA (bactofilin family)